jgi:sarcosine oxidase, subunit alpha
VGLVCSEQLEEGAQLIEHLGGPMLGHVTSAYWSETLHRPIALALLSAGRSRMGDALYVPISDRTIAVRVTDPLCYDKLGKCLDG